MLWPFGRKKEEEKVGEKSETPLSREKCALCNQIGADKKWAGQWWHTKCLRKARKIAKGMV